MLLQFCTPYCTNLRLIVTGRSGAHDNVNHTYNFRFQLLHQKIVSAYNFEAVCCHSHVQENIFSSNRFSSIQGKPYLGFENLGCHCKILGCHSDTQKQLKKSTDSEVFGLGAEAHSFVVEVGFQLTFSLFVIETEDCRHSFCSAEL